MLIIIIPFSPFVYIKLSNNRINDKIKYNLEPKHLYWYYNTYPFNLLLAKIIIRQKLKPYSVYKFIKDISLSHPAFFSLSKYSSSSDNFIYLITNIANGIL